MHFHAVVLMSTSWRDIWLVIIAFLMFLGTMWIYFRQRSGTFRRIRKLLEERVEVKTKQLSEKNQELEKLSLVASRADNAVVITDAQGFVEWTNEAFARLNGITPAAAAAMTGKHIAGLGIYPAVEGAITSAIEGKSSQQFESSVQTPAGKKLWISTTLTPVYDEQGLLKKLVLVDTDTTPARQLQERIRTSLHEKEILLKEIHHRVKNNLQIIISLLNLQSDYIKDEQTLKAVTDGQNRVRTMALVHEKFYQAEEVAEIDFKEYTEKLYQSYGQGNERIRVMIHSDPGIAFDMDTAMPCSLLLNEIVSNSYKYAFPGDREGEICIEFRRTPDKKIRMIISDNGIGVPEGFQPEGSESLGMQLIQALSNQLDGTLTFSSSTKGTRFEVEFVYPKILQEKTTV
jgi:PAS domain S-box-containing protein